MHCRTGEINWMTEIRKADTGKAGTANGQGVTELRKTVRMN